VNFALLWIDALVVSLLWVTTLAACVGRLKRRWLRGTLVPLVVGVPLFPLASFAFAAWEMKFVGKIGPDWFSYAISLLLAYLIGASIILRQSRRREPGLMPAAATWRRAPLALSLLIAAAVGYMALLNMDFALRARCAVLSVEVNSIYLATLPAITSDAQNAAPLYEKAFARLKAAREEEYLVQNPPTGNNDSFDPEEPAAITFLNHQAPTIALLRRAAALPGCRFDQDLLEPDINTILPDLNEERNAANVLDLDAREEVSKGIASSAIADATAILQMSRQLGRRPMLVSGLVGIGIGALGDKTLERTLPAVKNGNELAALHLDQLPSVGRTFQQSLRGEERYGLLLFGNMPPSQRRSATGETVQIEDTSILASHPGLAGPFVRVFFLDSEAYVQVMEKLESLSIKPYYQVRDELNDIQAAKNGRGLFTSLIISSMSRALETCSRVDAMDACAQAAVAATRFRLDHGTLPSDLDDLVPAYLDAVPLDPFDGHPLRLSTKNNQWIVYSVGPYLIDDGGVEMVQGKGDIIFVLKPAPTTATTTATSNP